MKCKKCKALYPDPGVIDGVAYFVCSGCGNFYEEQYSRRLAKSECAELFEREYGLKLPCRYAEYAGKNEDWVIKLPPSSSESTEYYFGSGIYDIGGFASISPEVSPTIFNTKKMVREWGLPERLVLLDGDGHTWLALDYRLTNSEPTVIVIETDNYNYLVVAKSFDEFTKKLLAYDSVYDRNGNIKK